MIAGVSEVKHDFELLLRAQVGREKARSELLALQIAGNSIVSLLSSFEIKHTGHFIHHSRQNMKR